MVERFRVTLSAPGEETAVLEGSFSEEEATTLDRFLDQYERLVDSRPLQEGVPCDFTMQIRSGGGTMAAELPAPDDLDVLFQRLRFFVLQEERTSFEKVVSIVGRHLNDIRLRELMKDQRLLFRNDPGRLTSRVVVNGVVITSEETLKDWMYGYEYHGDDERRGRLEKAGVDLQNPLIRHTLVGLLLNKMDAITSRAWWLYYADAIRASTCTGRLLATLAQGSGRPTRSDSCPSNGPTLSRAGRRDSLPHLGHRRSGRRRLQRSS